MDHKKLVSVWVRREVFQCGVLHVSPHTKLHKKNLRKILSYLKLKKVTFPYARYGDLNHVCCKKLQVEKSYCSTLFGIFQTLVKNSEGEVDKGASCNAPEEKDDDPLFSVYKFVLFLMIQQINAVNFTSSSINLREKWPSNESLNLSSSLTSTANVKSADDKSQLSFIINHLEEFIDILQGGLSNLTTEIVDSLGFLIEGHIDRSTQTVVPLDKLLYQRSVKLSAGFCADSGTYKYRAFIDWLKASFVINPYGILALKKSYCLLSWIRNPKTNNGENAWKGRVLTNAHNTIRNQKIIVLSKISNATLARSSKTLENSCVTLDRCFQSYIYLLSTLRMGNMRNCQNSQFVLGTIKLTISITDCKNCAFIISCKHLIISNCTDCTFYLMTSSRPVLMGNRNSGIKFAPYNATYPHLLEHLSRAGIAFDSNLWDQPISIANGEVSGNKIWTLLNPSEFYLCNIPFEMSEDQSKPNGMLPIPTSYKTVLDERLDLINTWNKLVNDADLTKEQDSELNRRIQGHFQEWLKTSGLNSELDGLEH